MKRTFGDQVAGRHDDPQSATAAGFEHARFALAGCLAALALAAAGPGAAGAALPPQGLYEQCAPNSTTIDCGQRLRTMAAAGFKYVVNYTAWSGSAQQVQGYADQAATAGVQVIWPLNDAAWRNGTDLVDHYPFLASGCGCSTNAAFKQFALGLVKDHPATWGFYIGDEVDPSAQSVAQVFALSQEVKQIALAKPILYVSPSDDLGQQLEPFAPAADFAGADYYPVGLEPDLSRTPYVARETREVANRHGKRMAMVLQAFSWSQYKSQGSALFPSRAEMQQMRDLTISNGDPDLVLWYSFNDVLDSGDPSGNWQNLSAAAMAPHIQLGPRRRCPGSKFRLTVRSADGLRTVRALVDGKLIMKTRRESSRVPVRGVGAGRHRLRVLATDSAGSRSKLSTRFRSCRR